MRKNFYLLGNKNLGGKEWPGHKADHLPYYNAKANTLLYRIVNAIETTDR
jgi:hypothetical protein